MTQNHTPNTTPPPTISQLSIIIKIKELYHLLYEIGFKIDKKNRYGIHKEIEIVCLGLLRTGIEAALSAETRKIECIGKMRVDIESLKHLIRMEYELKIIVPKKYLAVEELLVELSKMSLGWERTIQKRPSNTSGRSC